MGIAASIFKIFIDAIFFILVIFGDMIFKTIRDPQRIKWEKFDDNVNFKYYDIGE